MALFHPAMSRIPHVPAPLTQPDTALVCYRCERTFNPREAQRDVFTCSKGEWASVKCPHCGWQLVEDFCEEAEALR